MSAEPVKYCTAYYQSNKERILSRRRELRRMRNEGEVVFKSKGRPKGSTKTVLKVPNLVYETQECQDILRQLQQLIDSLR